MTSVGRDIGTSGEPPGTAHGMKEARAPQSRHPTSGSVFPTKFSPGSMKRHMEGCSPTLVVVRG